ncbi:MAG: ABC transporter ATP-binding protein [Desulfobacterales bacterium]
MKKSFLLELRRVSKSFSGVSANSQVDFQIKAGEIHALLGENGAGKSTLMNIICGLYQPDEGEIFIQGRSQDIRNSSAAINKGIGMIHQHFMLIPGFTSLENIILGSEPGHALSIDFKKARNRIARLSIDFGLPIDPDAITENLPVGIQQRVEIFKALYRKVDMLILDEPTAVLTPQEVDDLFGVMRRLVEKKVSIIFITHKLGEVLAVADRISVMRHGRITGTVRPDQTDEKQLAAMMVGREVMLRIDKPPARPGKPIFEVKNLAVPGSSGIEAVSDVSFRVREGEIIGIAGVQGNGQTELAEAVAGLRKVKAGSISLSGNRMPPLNPRKMIENGLAHIPEDRMKYGLVPSFSVAENQVLCSYYKAPFARVAWRNQHEIIQNSKMLIKRFDIRTTGPESPVQTLSGGNQQKVIISRELSRKIFFLLANQPTRGLDVGSIEYVHGRLIEMRNKGLGILLISSELDEIVSLSDTILVMYRGRIVSSRKATDFTKEELGLIMTRGMDRRNDSAALCNR